MSQLTDTEVAEYINTTNSIINAQKSQIEKLSKETLERAQFIEKVASLMGVKSTAEVLEKLSQTAEERPVNSWGQATTNVKRLKQGMRESDRVLYNRLGVSY
jgi:hypothetical protein